MLSDGESMRLFFIAVLLGIIGISQTAFATHHQFLAHKHKAHTYTHMVAVAPMVYGTGQLTAVLNNLIAANGSSADIAVYVKSMRNGDTLYSRNISRPLTPASTMKVLTAEAALLFLGADYRFSTQLLTDAKSVKNGVLQGNLYIVLSGDPSLTYDDLGELLMTLKSQQISAIAGNVYIDNTAYDQSFYGPGWIEKDRGYCYAAPISASIINHNCVSFQMTPAKVSGKLAQVVTPSKFLSPAIRNSVITKTRTRSCSLRLSTATDGMLAIDGCLSKGNYAAGVSHVVTDVPDYNRTLFKSMLNQVGVSVYGRVTFASAPDNLTLVGTHASQPLRVLLTEMLKKSDNIIAGALFKKLGQLYSHHPGSWSNGSLAVSQILSQQAGVSITGLRILDGSGLSPDNLATPNQMMQVLDYAYHHSTHDDFISALPIAGVDGTLKHRMYNIARKVRAKTGTISGVVSLAGYVVTADNEQLAFVIMVNGRKGFGWRYKAMEDKIATAMTRYKRV
jgi:D-alanyl-D-alanine carboxypeptidase/D-alanyl-D-alanine-endopeptidase (penicillin-binding protein 4)